MKCKIITTFLVVVLLAGSSSFSQEKIRIKNDTLPTALLVIDIQDFYFPGGKLPLVNPEEAITNVHASTLAILNGYYAKVVNSKDLK